MFIVTNTPRCPSKIVIIKSLSLNSCSKDFKCRLMHYHLRKWGSRYDHEALVVGDQLAGVQLLHEVVAHPLDLARKRHLEVPAALDQLHPQHPYLLLRVAEGGILAAVAALLRRSEASPRRLVGPLLRFFRPFDGHWFRVRAFVVILTQS